MLHNLTVVMPVWNRPESAASALSSLYKTAPDLKYVIIDQGSSSDTLQILSSYSELQEDTSLLIQEPVNLGRVHAFNRGIQASSSDLVLCISQEHTFNEGWVESMLGFFSDYADTAIVSPHDSVKSQTVSSEISAADPFCFMINKSLLNEDSLLDEQFSDPWIMMSDLSRRAWKKGLRTFASPGAAFRCSPLVIYGSSERREIFRKESEALYLSRWGESLSAVIYAENADSIYDDMLLGARHGDRYSVLVPHDCFASFSSKAAVLNHLSVSYHKLPKYFAGMSASRLIKKCSKEFEFLVTDGSSYEYDTDSLIADSVDNFIETVHERERKYYGDKI